MRVLGSTADPGREALPLPSALYQIGKVALTRKDTVAATKYFIESMELRRQLGEKPAIIESVESFAGVASAREMSPWRFVCRGDERTPASDRHTVAATLCR